MDDMQDDWGAECDAAIENVGEAGLAEHMQRLVIERVNGSLADAEDAAERAVLVAPTALAERVEEALRRLKVLSSGLHSRARYQTEAPDWSGWHQGGLEAMEDRKALFGLAREDLKTVPQPGGADRRPRQRTVSWS